MSFMPVLLWTDLMLFVMFGVALAYARHASRHAHLRAPWARVRRDPVAMGCALVLGAFVVIGLLDSLHLAVQPTLLGKGEALFEGLDLPALGYQVREVVPGEGATHVVIGRLGASQH